MMVEVEVKSGLERSWRLMGVSRASILASPHLPDRGSAINGFACDSDFFLQHIQREHAPVHIIDSCEDVAPRRIE